jgi:hypothetical protein
VRPFEDRPVAKLPEDLFWVHRTTTCCNAFRERPLRRPGCFPFRVYLLG